jgi:hypothetical protein
VVRLTEVFRQAAKSQIIVSAHRISPAEAAARVRRFNLIKELLTATRLGTS